MMGMYAKAMLAWLLFLSVAAALTMAVVAQFYDGARHTHLLNGARVLVVPIIVFLVLSVFASLLWDD